MSEWQAEIHQDGRVVAIATGHDQDAVTREGVHYANVFWQDGPCVLRVFRDGALVTEARYEGSLP